MSSSRPKHPPKSVAALDDLGRVQLSRSFFMRDFLYSEIAHFHGLENWPENPDLAIAAGRKICTELLEPLQDQFGRLAIRSAYRSKTVNAFGNAQQRAGKSGYSCSANERTYGCHIWDERDAAGHMGATVCLVVPTFVPLYERGVSWTALAWWIHDHLPYSKMFFFPKNAAFNLTWSEAPVRRIDSYIRPNSGTLTKPGMDNHSGDHAHLYRDLAPILRGSV
ncbi:hypothetical protein [Phaeobacter sp.]|uniref:hypothetical protein n=1 Tax=Phaeobacter sp. TaxID=1902409 RepID=UPI0025DCF5B0|nr:hypothetical protein [Phaeobacter sp.]